MTTDIPGQDKKAPAPAQHNAPIAPPPYNSPQQGQQQQGQQQQGQQQGQGGAQRPGKPAVMGKAKRRVRNFMLQPLLQVKIGLYSIILSVLFAVALGLIVYYNFAEPVNSILRLTDAEDEVRELVGNYWRGTQIWVYICFAVYLVANIGVSVFFTHRLVGPTIAFRRHIRSLAEGRYNARTYLRKGDAFFEVADELNHLSEVMEKTRVAHAHSLASAGQPK